PPAPVYIRAGIAAVAVPPSRPPAASAVVAPWSPPRIVVRITIGVADADGDAPTRSRTPRGRYANSVSVGCSIPVTANIRRIVPTRAVHNRRGGRRHHRAVIPGSVAHVYDIRRGAVYLDVSDVMERGTWRNRVDRWRNRRCHCPRPIRRSPHEPDRILDSVVVLVMYLDDRGRGVYRVVQVCAFDLLELGISVVLDLQLSLVASYRGCLRYGVRDQCFLGRPGSLYRDQYTGFGTTFGNFGE